MATTTSARDHLHQGLHAAGWYARADLNPAIVDAILADICDLLPDLDQPTPPRPSIGKAHGETVTVTLDDETTNDPAPPPYRGCPTATTDHWEATLVHGNDHRIDATFATRDAAIDWANTEEHRLHHRAADNVLRETFTLDTPDHVQYGTGYHWLVIRNLTS